MTRKTAKNLLKDTRCKNIIDSIKAGSKYKFIPPEEKKAGIANKRTI